METKMTMINSTRENARNSGLMGRVKLYLAKNRAARQLSQMDDRMLADIGLSRGDINARVWGN
jgi:uncharacterized protein YjiS (DUF1127 family)